MSEPSPILAYLTSALDRKLSSMPTDTARVRLLAAAFGNWLMLKRQFERDGSQPFGGPHPELGSMDAWDFANLLLEIQKRQRAIEAVPA